MNKGCRLHGLIVAMSVACLLVGFAPAFAHPGNHDAMRPANAPDPGVRPLDAGQTAVTGPSGQGAPLTAPLFCEQVAQGYKSAVRMYTGQVAHAHQRPPSGKGEDLGPPAEVWYVSTIKPVDPSATRLRYCVAPRLELPGNAGWAPKVTVKLRGAKDAGGPLDYLAQVENAKLLPAGASVEFASSGDWCVIRNAGGPDSPPTLYLVTDHGSGEVRFSDEAHCRVPRKIGNADSLKVLRSSSAPASMPLAERKPKSRDPRPEPPPPLGR